MKQLWKGKLTLRVKKEYPYYGTGGRHLEKVLIKDFFGWSVSLWTIHEDNPSGEFSDWTKEHLRNIFGEDCEIEHSRVHCNGHTYYTEDIPWIFNSKYSFAPTKNWQVLYDKNTNRYFGYSHRAVQSFGIGDMLFVENDKKYTSQYYKNRKYQWKFIKRLFHYYWHKDTFMFKDLVESGISSIIPFKDRGRKVIETNDEAFEAASNFAHYVS